MCAPAARSRAELTFGLKSFTFELKRFTFRLKRYGDRDHRRHHHPLRGHGRRTAAVDVRARRLRRHGREMVGARRLRQDQAHRPSAEKIHLHPVRPARMRGVGRPGRARDLGAVRGAGQGIAGPSQDRARPHHGRLHGLLPGAGVRGDASGGNTEHAALLARGRRQVPHLQPPAFRRAFGLRGPERTRGGGRARRQGRQAVRR